MKERPIIFSSEMVRAILEGRKTQTRRPIKPQPKIICPTSNPSHRYGKWKDKTFNLFRLLTEGFKLLLPPYCPYGQPGDRLWVKETWRLLDVFEDWWYGGYDADIYRGKIPSQRPNPKNLAVEYLADTGEDGPWRPSLHMPRWASRIMLEITKIRVERIQEISNVDVKAEGFAPWGDKYLGFADLWDPIYARKGFGWETNCWVWVIEFRRLESEKK